MSNVNIKRAVENIKTGTTIYSPIVEILVNAIEAIEEQNERNGKIDIVVIRSEQDQVDNGLSSVDSFRISDNGIGFTDENREAFDTLYTDQKIERGGKGFGRFVCLKYFNNLQVDSVFKNNGSFKRRTFQMGNQNEIIVNERIIEEDTGKTGSTITISGVKSGTFPDKKLKTIARNIVEKLLPYFISDNYKCPTITIAENDLSDFIVLNDSVNNELAGDIEEIPCDDGTFVLKAHSSSYEFIVRVFRLYSPRSQKSKVSLCAHNREVTDVLIHNHIPEFYDEFYEKIIENDVVKEKNFIVKAYVFSEYLNEHVSYERGGFEFHNDNDLIYGISQIEIEKAASKIAKNALGEEIAARQQKKMDRIATYVEEQAPWHIEILRNINLENVPYHPSNQEIESVLQKEKFFQEVSIKRDVSTILAEGEIHNIKEKVTEIVKRISGTSKNDLVHYVALRRNVLDLFKRSLELDSDGNYSSEGVVHDIIFPRRHSSDTASFDDHNLWIVDERLNFTHYVASDLPLNGACTDRPDLLVYDKRVLFRGDNEPSNPVTIFEFKRPQRDDFVNPSSKEDPVQQIVRYVNSIREGDYKTPEGRQILVADNTPFYGYLICDLTKKVKKWLEDEKDFKPMPDRLGWFQWRENINLYIEVLHWDKVLKDANMRNKVFFHKLGIL